MDKGEKSTQMIQPNGRAPHFSPRIIEKYGRKKAIPILRIYFPGLSGEHVQAKSSL